MTLLPGNRAGDALSGSSFRDALSRSTFGDALSGSTFADRLAQALARADGARRLLAETGSPGVVDVGAEKGSGGGVIENKHSTIVESSPPPLRVCMSIHPEC